MPSSGLLPPRDRPFPFYTDTQESIRCGDIVVQSPTLADCAVAHRVCACCPAVTVENIRGVEKTSSSSRAFTTSSWREVLS
mmetsp:Transcript_34106/g.67183  ORF Transcript_34106/g.67183 Transcript_34106/m.67183 type:complete len:81 (+) Transcript_34106:530-772(+)